MSLPGNVRDADEELVAAGGPIIWKHYPVIRAELHRLTEIAESVDPVVIRLGEVTTRLEAANALLRECYEWLFESLSDGPRVSEGAIEKHYYTPEFEAFHGRIQAHLQGAGDE